MGRRNKSMLEKKFINKLKKAKYIIIYGAGMVGGLVYKRLEFYGLEDKVLCFAVTNKSNQKDYLGVPLYQIDEMVKYRKTATAIIAALPNLHEEMQKSLIKYSFSHIILTTPALYQSMSKNYIKEFLKNKEDKDGDIDIVLMASDNNNSSGAFLCLADLGYELNQHGIKCKVILPEYGDGEKILIEKDVDYTYIPSEHWCIYKEDKRIVKLYKLHQNHRAVRELQKYFCRHKVKLVHNNTTYTYVGAIAASHEKLPVVWHLRENLENQGYDFMHRKQALRWINHANQIIVISDYMAKSIKGIDQRKVKIIYDGVDIDRYYCDRHILSDINHIVITMVGAVIAHKRQEELLKAAAVLKEKLGMGFQIRFIGKEEGNYIRKLKNMTEQYRLQDIVSFLGKQDKVEEFYRTSDIVVMCSRDEAFGRTTVEAQLSGCLVIGADSGATTELVRDGQTGILYRVGDAEDLAVHIIHAIENPKKASEIAKAGQEYARKIYSKENNAKEIIKVYEDIFMETP